MAKLTKAQQQDQQEAREALLEILKPGATVYTSCSHVARSGEPDSNGGYALKHSWL